MKPLAYYFERYRFKEEVFRNLMQKRIRRILLVATYYEAFIFEQESRLVENIYREFHQLNLSNAPQVFFVPDGQKALEMLKQSNWDMVITMTTIGGMSAFDLVERIRQTNTSIPVQLLLGSQNDYALLAREQKRLPLFTDVFMWNGNPKLFLAITKSVEDKLNIAHDTEVGQVRLILLVEDSVHYYSLFLPLFYTEVMRQTQMLIEEEVSVTQKQRRMRVRPKVILTHSYEEALTVYQKYKDYVLCVITDSKYKKDGKKNRWAGVELVKAIQQSGHELPMIIQSSDAEVEERVKGLPVQFFNKNSANLFYDMRHFLTGPLGFGPFIFRTKQQEYIDIAHTVKEFEQKIFTIPEESLIYHSQGNHFSTWLRARGEIEAANKMRSVTIKDFSTTADMREYLNKAFARVRDEKVKGRIIDFDPSSLTDSDHITRLAEGSLGGKGRGLAFLNALLASLDDTDKPEGADIVLPATAIIGTDEFDLFIRNNKIEQQIKDKTDAEIDQIFADGELSAELISRLKQYLQQIDTPIAVRSSGLLEDNMNHPFAGVYHTYLLPNCGNNLEQRLQKLTLAIKLVYASLFHHEVRAYIKNTSYNLEEEKMAVILQKVAGQYKQQYFGPHFSGVAQSYNYYPAGELKHEDGLATLAVGLGKAVVERQRTFSYCPRYPNVDVFAKEIVLQNSPRYYWAIRCCQDCNLLEGEDSTLAKIKLDKQALKNEFVGLTSVWDTLNQQFIDSTLATGPRVVTYRPVVRYERFPLNKIINLILEMGQTAMGTAIEIEFSVDLTPKPVFYILQIRPLALHKDFTEVTLQPDKNPERIVINAGYALGHGQTNSIKDLIFLPPERFNNLKTIEMRQELEELNNLLGSQNKRYILVGAGRWGSSDPFLGVPVKWAHINNAGVIAEVLQDGLNIEASNGSHFFHNLMAMNVPYLTVVENNGADQVNWNWLNRQPIVNQGNYFTHISLHHSFIVQVDGKAGKALIRY